MHVYIHQNLSKCTCAICVQFTVHQLYPGKLFKKTLYGLNQTHLQAESISGCQILISETTECCRQKCPPSEVSVTYIQ